MKKTSPVSAQCLSALLLTAAGCKLDNDTLTADGCKCPPTGKAVENEVVKAEVISLYPITPASEVKAVPTAEGFKVTFLFPPGGVGDIRIYRQEENAKGVFRLSSHFASTDSRRPVVIILQTPLQR